MLSFPSSSLWRDCTKSIAPDRDTPACNADTSTRRPRPRLLQIPSASRKAPRAHHLPTHPGPERAAHRMLQPRHGARADVAVQGRDAGVAAEGPAGGGGGGGGVPGGVAVTGRRGRGRRGKRHEGADHGGGPCSRARMLGIASRRLGAPRGAVECDSTAAVVCFVLFAGAFWGRIRQVWRNRPDAAEECARKPAAEHFAGERRHRRRCSLQPPVVGGGEEL
mmetsp:Transcript_10626/g.26649  ORF Transcript_10626/g.26649 Transcript_10626/m.26649 type:complete len:221 (+) Transcript_10626:141-803(+)